MQDVEHILTWIVPGNKWDTSLCPDNDSCAKNCCLDGAQYASTYGASTSGDALSLNFVTKGGSGTNVGSRLYLMASGKGLAATYLLGRHCLSRD